MFLYNSHGFHVANFLNQSLYTPAGECLGSYVPQLNIFVDLNGNYLGEVVEDHYLISKMDSPYLNMKIGVTDQKASINAYSAPILANKLPNLGFDKDVVISSSY